MKNYKSKIEQARAIMAEVMTGLKKEARETLDGTPSLPGVTPVKGSVRCAIVRASALASNGFNLSPEYYIQDHQTDVVSGYLLFDGITYEEFQRRLALCLKDKAVTVKGSKCQLNPNTLSALEKVQAALA